MPFGLNLADWDKLLSDVELETFFNQLIVINNAEKYTLALLVYLKDVSRVWKAMEEKGFVDVHPVFIYKPSQNQRGVGCFIFAVEVVLVGYKGGRPKLSFDEPSPMLRHNLIQSTKFDRIF